MAGAEIRETVKLVYFAWVRERIGLAEEKVALPGTIKTVSDLLNWLASRGENYAYAMAEPDIIRVALDKKHVEHGTSILDAREIALFPPMTGG